MPTISYFFGIYIKMYFDDHFPPHFHAEYQEHEASISIQDGGVLAGTLPRSAVRLIEDWRKMHEAELLEAWEAAKNEKLPKPIAPLED